MIVNGEYEVPENDSSTKTDQNHPQSKGGGGGGG